MSDVIVYSTANCGYCVAAKNLLKSRGADYQEIRVDNNPEALAEMIAKTKRNSVPQIFINGSPIGGYDQLIALDREGKLKTLLEAAP